VGTHGLTRRQWLKGTSGAVLAGYVALSRDLSSAAPLAGDQEEVAAGVVERIEPPNILKIRGFREGPVSISFSDDAAFWRGHSGRVAGLDVFILGDEVVAEGQWTASGFAATTLMSMYRLIEGRVVHRKDNRLQTTGGIVQLTSDTVLLDGDGFVDKTLDGLAVGDDIVAEVWRDPSTRDLVALRIGVRKAGA